ncbi:MAG: hypothetical protein UZ11_BCD004001624 [Bacteroidetes bacterium OLB11]|nr:MAG: hypothetical protein UZ11_BCD004001624 [Bacteroidetes bacterium OLB11]
MKKLLIILLLCPLFSIAQEDYSFKDIAGKWIEATRTDKSSIVSNFKDTIYLEIRDDGFMLVRPLIGKTYFGDAEIKKNKIILKGETFEIDQISENLMKLKHGKYLHRFIPFSETSEPQIDFSGQAEQPKEIKTSTKSLLGNWTVYKKTDKEFDTKKIYIKSLELVEVNLDNLLSGTLTVHSMNKQSSSPVTIFIEGVEMNMATDTNKYKAQMLRNDGNEMILKIGTVTYYLKKF